MLEQDLLELLAINSETGNEQKISTLIEEKNHSLQKFNLKKKGYNLCYFSKDFQPNQKTIAFYGHLDTVKNQQTIPVQKDKDFIYGCGASDMKAGIAVMINLMKILDKTINLPYNYQFIFYTGEEGPYHQSGLEGIFSVLTDLKKASIAFILEPTNNNIQSGCLGSLRIKGKIFGKSGHSARPWLAENAIHKSWALLKYLKELVPKKITNGSLDFYEVISATMVKGGILPNMVPDKIEFLLNYRYAPDKNSKKAQEEFLQQFSNKLDEIEIIESAPSAPVVTNKMIKDIIQKFSNKFEPKQAWTDIARLALEGIPAVNLGAGDPKEAHQKDEKVKISQLYKSLEIYRYITLNI